MSAGPIEIGNAILWHGDCREILPQVGPVDSIVTDPPYHLVNISERAQYPVKHGRDGAMGRLLKGFMGTSWDGGDIAFQPDTWRLALNALRPGGFLLAFGGTRTWHRMATAIEDAGFVLQDTLAWLYGSGFPKRKNALKPAFEPIILAYRPGGARTLQIDECRIPAERRPAFAYHETDCKHGYNGGIKGGEVIGTHDLGRWPANVVHDGSEDVIEAFPDSKGQQASTRRTESSKPFGGGGMGRGAVSMRRDGESSAGRFFYCAKANAQDRWGSKHPTVKPLELLQWLVPLVTPPNGTVLDPFGGSGTTGAAALTTGRRAVLIEREDEYAADIVARLIHYTGAGVHSLNAINRRIETVGADDMPLFRGKE